MCEADSCSAFRCIPKEKLTDENESQPIPPSRVSVTEEGMLCVLPSPAICDACKYCNDTCSLQDCESCKDKLHKRSSKRQRKFECFSPCQIKRHRNLGSCWVVAQGQVYDITSILNRHPGGINCLLLKAGGEDITDDLNFHSKQALKTLEKLKIGILRNCPIDQQDDSESGCSIC
mmetsp:Transcript_18212/g.23998  ORF Transcript_18212/g.23998 Transcript_18212/m.23998 type:complete len:175 (-) Transcript_18212:280-804(-)